MLFNAAQLMRCLRAVILLRLAWMLLTTIMLPEPTEYQAEELWSPAWLGNANEDVKATYYSTLLLRRCHSHMHYNNKTQRFETGPMDLWRSTELMMTSRYAAGWATWQELAMTAKNPWAVYWADQVAPDSWHIMPQYVRENLQLFEAGVPVLTPADLDAKGVSGDELILLSSAWSQILNSSWVPARVAAWFQDSGKADFIDVLHSQRWIANCCSAVNGETLKPMNEIQCTVGLAGNDSHATGIIGSFTILPNDANPVAAAADAATNDVTSTVAGVLADKLVAKPQQQMQQQQPKLRRRSTHMGQNFANNLRVLWYVYVPTGSLDALQPLWRHMAVLQEESFSKVMALYLAVLLVSLRNYLYLLSVTYKISRRFGELAFQDFWGQVNGVLLTLLGVFVGLWQNFGYAVLDLALDVCLLKLVAWGIRQFPGAGAASWSLLYEWGMFEATVLYRCYKLAKCLLKGIRQLVMNPDEFLLQQQPIGGLGVDKALRMPVKMVGSWPEPLKIPEQVDDLPLSEVPRGFICPITQAIMRQPALLLHDRTIAPSTYDKDAIAQWLAAHSTDPKNPGTKLRMKAVRLMYNGDLARAIDDWVVSTAAAKSQLDRFVDKQQWRRRQRQQQDSMQEQQQHHHQQNGLNKVSNPSDSDTEEAHSGSAHAEQAAGHSSGRHHWHAAAAADDAEGAGPSAAGTDTVSAGRQARAGRPLSAAAGFAAAGHIVRQSSSALTEAGGLGAPSIVASGLASIAETAQRVATRAAARRRQQQQEQGGTAAVAAAACTHDGSSSSSDSEGDGETVSSARRTSRTTPVRRAAPLAAAAAADGFKVVFEQKQPARTPASRRIGSRGATPPLDNLGIADGAGGGDGFTPRRSTRRRSAATAQ
eukprot:GHRR01000511.1.p1 GENE.GHRR01000511.1~~GHRR01000511.1.p1  ORF type:complete len:876 (+),score=322.05 GHRR01000511.1:263-2890(+)